MSGNRDDPSDVSRLCQWLPFVLAAILVAAMVVLSEYRKTLWLVTGYCNCAKCCGRETGITASGKRTHHGTIAADPAVFKFGTRLEVPGYGVGVVEDTGSMIKGRHIDVWFPTHEEAKRWGAKRLKIKEIK